MCIRDRPRTGSGPRRLSAVGADDELPLGEDAIGMVSEEHPAEEPTEDLSATAAAVRAHERSTGPTAADEPAATGDADWIATQASERPERVELGSESDPEVAEPQAVDTEDTEQAEEPEPPRRAAKKGRRASVPSWDEIMFGGGKRE